jgi:spore coat polysaccharide biosynthesis protein SpsF
MTQSITPPLHIVAIIQARMNSSRLPGKVMRLLHGQPVISWVVRRVKSCPLVDQVVVATTTSSCDDPVAEAALAAGAVIWRGSEDNVLSRYCDAAAHYQATDVIRITADCPLYDPHVLTAMLEQWRTWRQSGVAVDYLSNTWQRRTWPRGFDTEIFTREVLKTICAAASQAYELEHVTPYIYQHSQQFTLRTFPGTRDLSHHRWTLDTLDDWHLIAAIYNALGDETTLFSTEAILEFLKTRPELSTCNQHVHQKGLHE